MTSTPSDQRRGRGRPGGGAEGELPRAQEGRQGLVRRVGDATPSALRLLIDATGASAADFFPSPPRPPRRRRSSPPALTARRSRSRWVRTCRSRRADCVAFAAGGAPRLPRARGGRRRDGRRALASAVESPSGHVAGRVGDELEQGRSTRPSCTGWAATSGYAAHRRARRGHRRRRGPRVQEHHDGRRRSSRCTTAQALPR